MTAQTTLAAYSEYLAARKAAIARIADIMLPGARALSGTRTPKHPYHIEVEHDLSTRAPFSGRTVLVWRDRGKSSGSGVLDGPYDQQAPTITGTKGGNRPVYAMVYVRPVMLLAMLAPASVELMVAKDAAIEGRPELAVIVAEGIAAAQGGDTLTQVEHGVLRVFGEHRGGARERPLAELAAGGPTWSRNFDAPGKPAVDAAIERLVAGGYLKRAKNGATALTTKGKNAHTAKRGY